MNTPLTVLIVEDNPGVADTYVKWTQTYDTSKNLTVEVANRYSDAVARMEDGFCGNKPRIDVVVLDLMLPADPLLPNGSGLEVLRDIRNRWLFLPIIVVSGMDVDENDVMHAGACSYFVKGAVSGKDLVHTIRKDWVRRDSMKKSHSVADTIRTAEEGLKKTEDSLHRLKETLASATAVTKTEPVSKH